MKRRIILQALLLLLTLSLTAFAQLDDRLVGRWKSSTGAIIDIKYPRVGDGSYTKMVINNSLKIDAQVEDGDMDSKILTYTSGGTEMKAYLDPTTNIITVYKGEKEYGTWKKI